MALSVLNRISIASIVVYTPALLVAIFLSLRHGFGKNAGWLYLIILSLSRLIGSSFQLATINDPTNESLVIGTQVLSSVGVSALVVTVSSLLGRVLESIRRDGFMTHMSPQHQRLAQLVVLVGMILSIIGGSTMGDEIGDAMNTPGMTVKVVIPLESKAGLGLIMGGFAIVALGILATLTQFRTVEKGEKRLLIAITCVLPLLVVRLVFAGLATYGTDVRFKSWGSSSAYVWWYLGMAVIMEMVTVAVLEGVGMTLKKIPRAPSGQSTGSQRPRNSRLGRRRRRRRGFVGRFAASSKQEEGRVSDGIY